MRDNIPGLPGYHITRDGKLYSRFHKSGHSMTNTYHLLHPTIRNSGYLGVQKKGKYFGIHRLVATVYIPNPDNKPFVCHKNNIRTDNRVENLYWGTHKENMEQMIREGRSSKGSRNPMYGVSRRGALNPNSKLTKSQRVEIRQRHKNGERICDLAEQYKVSRITIRRVVNKYIKPLYYRKKRLRTS